jgi:hypothetical protein
LTGKRANGSTHSSGYFYEMQNETIGHSIYFLDGLYLKDKLFLQVIQVYFEPKKLVFSVDRLQALP